MRGQFYVMAAIVLVFNLIVINQFIARSASPPVMEQVEEINYAKTFEANLRDVEASPPYLLKRNLDIFQLTSQQATSRGFAVSIQCCKSSRCVPYCSSYNMANLTNLNVTLKMMSGAMELRSDLPFR